jgi:hypothetical protein
MDLNPFVTHAPTPDPPWFLRFIPVFLRWQGQGRLKWYVSQRASVLNTFSEIRLLTVCALEVTTQRRLMWKYSHRKRPVTCWLKPEAKETSSKPSMHRGKHVRWQVGAPVIFNLVCWKKKRGKRSWFDEELPRWCSHIKVLMRFSRHVGPRHIACRLPLYPRLRVH